MLGIGQPSDLFSSSAQQYVNRSNPMSDLLLAPESQSARVLARPNYKAALTPRSDPFANTGSIRGNFAPIGQTAVHPSALMSQHEMISSNQTPDTPHSILSDRESYSEKKEKNLINAKRPWPTIRPTSKS